MIEILSSGAGNSIQDLGRPGYLNQGIGRGGAMDRPALMVANMMVGNPLSAAGLEIGMTPFRLRFETDMMFAVTGAAADIRINQMAIPCFWSMAAKSGDELRIGAMQAGARLYVAFEGGIDVPSILGSRATDLKSGFGGLHGRPLARGDKLSTLLPDEITCRAPHGFGLDPSALRPIAGGKPSGETLDIRCMIGAEWSRFTPDAQNEFLSQAWIVSQDNNRQGMKLDGPSLALIDRLELFSHGLLPGTIQVPPSGQMIIQLAEANTCGGYPKIAHVIEPDLWKLAQAPSGASLRFVPVSPEQARNAIALEAGTMKNVSQQISRMIRPSRTQS